MTTTAVIDAVRAAFNAQFDLTTVTAVRYQPEMDLIQVVTGRYVHPFAVMLTENDMMQVSDVIAAMQELYPQLRYVLGEKHHCSRCNGERPASRVELSEDRLEWLCAGCWSVRAAETRATE